MSTRSLSLSEMWLETCNQSNSFGCYCLTTEECTWHAIWPIICKHDLKLEVHNISQCSQKRTVSQSQSVCTKHTLKFGHVVSEIWAAVIQTDWHTYHNSCTCSGREAINHRCVTVYKWNSCGWMMDDVDLRHRNQCTTTRENAPTLAKWGRVRNLRTNDIDLFRKCGQPTRSTDLHMTTGHYTWMHWQSVTSNFIFRCTSSSCLWTVCIEHLTCGVVITRSTLWRMRSRISTKLGSNSI